MWNIIKVLTVFIITFFQLQSAQVSIRQHSRSFSASAGPWRERISHWYDVTIIRSNDEDIYYPHTFRVINQHKRVNSRYPTFGIISNVLTPEGVKLEIVGDNINLNGNMSITSLEFNGSNLSGTLRSTNGGGRAIIDVQTILEISSSVPDMIDEPIVWANPDGGDTNSGLFNLKTLPTIDVPDFDFGRVLMNDSETSLVLYESDKVFITGGTPNTSVKVFVTQPQVDLVCANTEDTLRVDFAFYSPIIRLDSTGYASSMLEASLRTDQVVDSGVYTGTVEVQVEYN